MGVDLDARLGAVSLRLQSRMVLEPAKFASFRDLGRLDPLGLGEARCRGKNGTQIDAARVVHAHCDILDMVPEREYPTGILAKPTLERSTSGYWRTPPSQYLNRALHNAYGTNEAGNVHSRRLVGGCYLYPPWQRSNDFYRDVLGWRGILDLRFDLERAWHKPSRSPRRRTQPIRPRRQRRICCKK
jgi:hypothetical protein